MRIGILTYPGCSIWSASAPMEMFTRANKAYEYFSGSQRKRFEVSYVTPNNVSRSGVFSNFNGKVESIQNHKPFDMIIVPAFEKDPEKVLIDSKECISWFVKQYTEGVVIVSLCSGSVLMAASGLLKNRKGTTHWMLKEYFENKFPEIPLDFSSALIDYGDIILSGSATSYQNVVFLIIERFMGRSVAVGVSKVYLMNMVKDPPYSYMNLAYEKQHGDEKVKLAQDYINANFSRMLSLDEIANKVNLNKRTFIRRFKNAICDTPLNYINRLKVEKAKYLLENGLKTFEEITFSLGYEDVSAFRKVFTKHTGVTPMMYRSRYQLNN